MQVYCGGGGVFAHTLVWVSLVRVVSAHMLDNLEFLFGFVAAETAEEGVAVGVGEGMMAQASSPAESTVAHVTHIGFGLTVLAEVGAQQEACLEGLATLLTHEGPCFLVPSLLVHTQGIGSVGAVLTFGTLIWLQSCVFGHVVLELVDPLALVATVRAQIFPFLLMDPHMVLEARGVSTGIGTEMTVVGLFPSMNAAVPGDLLPVLGAVSTVSTFVEPGAPMRFHMVI